jgi:hypothetical protein
VDGQASDTHTSFVAFLLNTLLALHESYRGTSIAIDQVSYIFTGAGLDASGHIWFRPSPTSLRGHLLLCLLTHPRHAPVVSSPGHWLLQHRRA